MQTEIFARLEVLAGWPTFYEKAQGFFLGQCTFPQGFTGLIQTRGRRRFDADAGGGVFWKKGSRPAGEDVRLVKGTMLPKEFRYLPASQEVFTVEIQGGGGGKRDELRAS